MKVAVIKYNAGNIRSVDYALRRLGVEAEITADEAVLRAADKVIFPGVGEAETTMNFLNGGNMGQLIKELRQPVLGICLGMQLMCRHSEEGNVDCLGIFDVDVKRFVSQKHEDKVPHMGWNSLHVKKVEEATIRVTQDITLQIKHAFNIGIVIVVVIIFTLLLKLAAKRYIKDNERFYLANKIINFANITLIVIVLLFAYLENVSYLVTVLGFASAGIAIAMKDWFMSILGWMVIVFGGSFHVGDRIKVRKDGLSYVGDIIDISLLRMTVLEDVTLTTYLENVRAGRVFFVPNNMIFTSLISNYTHGTIRTVWDGIYIYITFDSNHKKAVHIAREITKKYSKGYTDIARKQLNLLRNQYSLKNTNVEPRVFAFVEGQGFCVNCWYMTNSYAALTLRGTIGCEIIDAFNQESDIKIAYQTQNINLGQQEKPSTPPNEPVNTNEKSLF